MYVCMYIHICICVYVHVDISKFACSRCMGICRLQGLHLRAWVEWLQGLPFGALQSVCWSQDVGWVGSVKLKDDSFRVTNGFRVYRV